MEDVLNEKSVFEEVPTEKIYTEKAIAVGTFLGGPLVAGYLMSENFKVFHESNKVAKTWIISILSTIAVFRLIFVIPESINIPNVLFPLIYMGIVGYLTKIYQQQNINQHIEKGGETFSGWRTAGISIVGCMVTIMPIVGFVFFNQAANGEITELSKSYGIMNHQISYQNTIKEDEVDKIAHALTATTFFDDAQTKYIYLEKIDHNYEISIACDESVQYNPVARKPFSDLQKGVQKYFPHNKIVLKLVIDNIENIVVRLE